MLGWAVVALGVWFLDRRIVLRYILLDRMVPKKKKQYTPTLRPAAIAFSHVRVSSA